MESSDDARHDRYAYRHPKGSEPALNLLFFDGHAVSQGKEDAISKIDQWYPSGTYVRADEFTEGPHPKPRADFEVQKRAAQSVNETPSGAANGPFFPIF